MASRNNQTNDWVGTFAKFFTHLTDNQRFQLDRALGDVQNSKEITNLESSIKLLRRKPDQQLPIPQPTARIVVRGAVIEWPNLLDQRISFYEVEVSENQNFATFDTFPTFGTVTVIDGLTQTKFIRVRGVRRDGTCTPYSETLPIAPRLFGLNSHETEGFYILIVGDEPNIILGGEGTDLDYIPINETGNSVCWGFISMYADPAVGLFGLDHIFADVVVKKLDDDGDLISEDIIWRVTMGEFFNSQNIGPFTIDHPPLGSSMQIRLEVTDKTTKADGTTRTEDSSTVYWCHLSCIELGV